MSNIHFQIAKRLAYLLDNQFEILGIRFGLDPLLDLIPGIGDIIDILLGLYIIYVAKEMGVPQDKLNRMVVNSVIDFIIGLFPGLGAIGTVFYRSNMMNIRIIEDYFQSKRSANIEEGVIVR